MTTSTTSDILQWDLSKDGKLVTGTSLLDVLPNEESVMESVVNIVMAERSTKIYKKRDFGVSLSKYLFEPIDISSAISIYEEIESGIDKFEPRALDVKVEVSPQPNQNTFIIDIFFRIEESNNVLKLTLNLNKIR